MPKEYNNRLTVVGPARQITRFLKASHWPNKLGAEHIEIYQQSPDRHVWWFETSQIPLGGLHGLSHEYPKLILLLDYECDEAREKGIAKTVLGRIESCHMVY